MSVKETEDLLSRIRENWDVISATFPLSLIILVALAGLGCWLTFKLTTSFHAQAVKNAESARDAAEERRMLAEERRDLYKTESENAEKQIQALQKELEKSRMPVSVPRVPTELAPVIYGNAAVQNVYLTVSSATRSEVRVTSDDHARFAALTRLLDAGMLQVKVKTPQYTVVEGTRAASDWRPEFDKINQSLKKGRE